LERRNGQINIHQHLKNGKEQFHYVNISRIVSLPRRFLNWLSNRQK